MDQETILTLVADIAAAHVSNNNVAADELPKLIQSVYGALNNLGRAEPEVQAALTPAVSVRASVKPDSITCLDCGQKFKMLKRHLSTDHNLSPAEYKVRWNLTADYPLVAPDYAAQRKALAVKIGLGRKPGDTGKKGGRKKLSASFASD